MFDEVAFGSVLAVWGLNDELRLGVTLPECVLGPDIDFIYTPNPRLIVLKIFGTITSHFRPAGCGTIVICPDRVPYKVIWEPTDGFRKLYEIALLWHKLEKTYVPKRDDGQRPVSNYLLTLVSYYIQFNPKYKYRFELPAFNSDRRLRALLCAGIPPTVRRLKM